LTTAPGGQWSSYTTDRRHTLNRTSGSTPYFSENLFQLKWDFLFLVYKDKCPCQFGEQIPPSSPTFFYPLASRSSQHEIGRSRVLLNAEMLFHCFASAGPVQASRDDRGRIRFCREQRHSVQLASSCRSGCQQRHRSSASLRQVGALVLGRRHPPLWFLWPRSHSTF